MFYLQKQILNQIWCEALKPLSFDQIAEGTRRCLLECEYFPPIATFRDKAIQGRKLALLNEKSKQPQIEDEQKGIPMPEKFKELIKELRKQKLNSLTTFVWINHSSQKT